MKKAFFITLFTVISYTVYSQDYSKLVDYNFKNAETYKTSEPQVLECSNYLFNNPSNKNELNRLACIQYIMKWMEGTPDYTFSIGSNAVELTKGSSDLFGLYLAAMTKVVLENTGESLNNDTIHNKAQDILVNYCANSGNNIKPSKKIKKILKKNK